MTTEWPIRRFVLARDEDESGVSGTGIVAYGCEFHDGSVCMVWRNAENPDLDVPNGMSWKPAPNGIEATKRIHGHEGRTRIEWIDA